jgi:RNA polymerase sigma factor (TIGR02999 family)
VIPYDFYLGLGPLTNGNAGVSIRWPCPCYSPALILDLMSEVTRILNAIEHGDANAAGQLWPLVYDELRTLAAQQMAQEAAGQTLQPTALVHEAYLRLVDIDQVQHWNSRGHFFAAAAEAMRRILVERARSKRRVKRGGGARRQELQEHFRIAEDRLDELLAVHEALDELERHEAQAAALVKLRFFAGFEHQEAAEMLGLNRRAADRLWLLARTWLYRALAEDES